MSALPTEGERRGTPGQISRACCPKAVNRAASVSERIGGPLHCSYGRSLTVAARKRRANDLGNTPSRADPGRAQSCARLFACALALVALPAAGEPPVKRIEARVDAAKTHQTLRGFGACFFMHDITDYCDPKFYDDLVFDLGITMVRYPMPSYFDPPDSDNPRLAAERVSRDAHKRQMAFIRSFVERGVEDIYSTPWSPPAWMKTNRQVEHAGHLRPDRREDFAAFLSGSVQHLKKQYGLELAAVSIQNELMFPEPYGSSVYNGHSLRETVRTVMRRFKKDGLSTKMLFPEDTMPQFERILDYIRPVMADAETSGFHGHFAVHHSAGVEGWHRLRATLDNYCGREMWQTETSVAGADWPTCLNNVRLMHNGLAAGNVSVWTIWQFSMLHFHGQPTSNYHAFRPFFRFVRPGAAGMESSPIDGDVVVSAWRHDAGSNLTVILINQLKGPAAVSLAVAGVKPASFRVYRTSANEKAARLPDLPGSPNLEVEMPAESIVVLQSGTEINIPRPSGISAKPPIAAYLEDVDEKLHRAARWGNVAEVKLLLAEGRDPNARGVGGWAPLHRAAFPGHANIVAPLVAAGADPNLPGRSLSDTDGDTPLHIAAAQGRLEMVKALLDAGARELGDSAGWTPLHRAALGGKADVAAYLVARSFNVRAKDGWTPLHAAAGAVYDGSWDILRLLLERGADPNARCAEGWTPLHAAAQGMTAWGNDPQLVVKKLDALIAAGCEGGCPRQRRQHAAALGSLDRLHARNADCRLDGDAAARRRGRCERGQRDRTHPLAPRRGRELRGHSPGAGQGRRRPRPGRPLRSLPRRAGQGQGIRRRVHGQGRGGRGIPRPWRRQARRRTAPSG